MSRHQRRVLLGAIVVLVLLTFAQYIRAERYREAATNWQLAADKWQQASDRWRRECAH